MRTSLHQMIFEKVDIIQILCLEYLFAIDVMKSSLCSVQVTPLFHSPVSPWFRV